jgi:hypothetical protein
MAVRVYEKSRSLQVLAVGDRQHGGRRRGTGVRGFGAWSSGGLGRGDGKFLVSNELWGGSGSIADSVFCGDQRFDGWDVKKNRLRQFEGLMIRLGRLQMDAGRANIRTAMWVEAFKKWRSTL